MRKVALVLAVLSILLLVTHTSLWLLVTHTSPWQTFYLDPSDPHWVKKEDPAGKLTDAGDRWISNCLAGDPRPKIYFKILEFGERGGLIRFYYAKSYIWNQLHLYASKDGIEYVELWKSPAWGRLDKTEVLVEIPPGYKYFYFHLRDGDGAGEKITLWKEIQFKIGLPTPPSPTPPSPWQTFYLDPSDPHWVKKEDPGGKLIDEGNKWVSYCLAGDPRPKIYFKIPELDDKGGYIKFYYEKSDGWNVLHLYASKDGTKYVELWKSPVGEPLDIVEIVEIPPGYKYFYFYFRDGDLITEKIILWKKIQFVTLETPTPVPTLTPPPTPTPTPTPPPGEISYVKTEFEAEEGYVGSSPPPVPTPTPTPSPAPVPTPPPSTPQPAPTPQPLLPRLGIENSDLLITCIAIAVVALTVARLKKV